MRVLTFFDSERKSFFQLGIRQIDFSSEGATKACRCTLGVGKREVGGTNYVDREVYY